MKPSKSHFTLALIACLTFYQSRSFATEAQLSAPSTHRLNNQNLVNSEAELPLDKKEAGTLLLPSLQDKIDFPDPKKMQAIIEKAIRIDHAHELLGKYYKKSAVKSGEKYQKISKYIFKWVSTGLPKKYKKKAKLIASTIHKEANNYELDPVFIISMIETESNYDPAAIGPFKEIGLMQLRPETAKWIAGMKKMKWKGKKSLKDPIINIKLGTAYIAWLRDQFDSHSQLYLAAYNMGATNVQKALDKDVWPKDYPRRVMKKYVSHYEELDNEL